MDLRTDQFTPKDDTLLVVVGPTASGKTDLAIELAERLGAEIISADSVQIYRSFDLGSGKPSAEQLRLAPHHLVSIVDPLSPFDAAQFVLQADRAIEQVRSSGRRPIVCGGSFLWVKALLFGLAASPPADPELRRKHRAAMELHGRAALHAELEQIDPEAAARIAANDFVRVSRALEVFQLTGKTQTTWHQEHQFKTLRHSAELVGVARSRDELDKRIAQRTHAWLSGGWIEEVVSLLSAGYREARAMSAVGYCQVRAHLDGELPREELHEAIVRATRTFVRRQRTWLRDQPVQWLQPAAAT